MALSGRLCKRGLRVSGVLVFPSSGTLGSGAHPGPEERMDPVVDACPGE